MSIQDQIQIMPCLSYRVGDGYQSDLFIEDVALDTIAREYGDPVWVISRQALLVQAKQVQQAFAGMGEDLLIAASVKANGNTHLLRELSNLGIGADITSDGELDFALEAGISPNRIVFAGVGKESLQIDKALSAGIRLFNVESEGEMNNIEFRARLAGKKARVSIRFNPNVDGLTHELTTTGLLTKKFGVENALDLAVQAAKSPNLELVGLQVHIGSPIYRLDQVVHAFNRLMELYSILADRGIKITEIDLGGQIPIDYGDGKYGEDSTPEYLAERVVPTLKKLGVTLILEPGRFLFGNTCVLVSKLLYVKANSVKTFYIQSAGQNDLDRPARYRSHHSIVPTLISNLGFEEIVVDVVGPICESGDFLAQDCLLPTMPPGAYLATLSAGAYGYSMSSNYNGRPRAPEVLVDGETHRLIRRRETVQDLLRTLREV